MSNRIFFCLTVLLLLGAVPVSAQVVPPEFGEETPDNTIMLPRGMNQKQLMQMRVDLMAEIRVIQQQFKVLDPNDKQFTDYLKTQQANAIEQLTAVDQQLRKMGINPEPAKKTDTPKIDTAVAETEPAKSPLEMLGGSMEEIKPTRPKGESIESNPEAARFIEDIKAMNTAQGRKPQLGAAPNERAPRTPGLPPEFGAPETLNQFGPRGVKVPDPNNPIAGFGQPPHEFAEPESPWAPKPSKEMTELKQSVDSLQAEVKQLRDQIKSLETQIQLLTRSIVNDANRRNPITE